MKKGIYKELKKILLDNKEEYFLVMYYIFLTKFKIKFNKQLCIQCNYLKIEFLKAYDLERIIINLLIKNIDNINIDELENIINILDEKNTELINHIYASLDDIEDAYYLEQDWRANIKKNDNLLIYNIDSILFRIFTSLITFEDLLEYMEFPIEFINYLKNDVDIIKHNPDDHKDTFFFGVYPKVSEDGRLEKYRIIIPKITDLETLLINVHEIKHAYDLYLILGEEINTPFEEYEQIAREEEQKVRDRLYNGSFIDWKKRNNL